MIKILLNDLGEEKVILLQYIYISESLDFQRIQFNLTHYMYVIFWYVIPLLHCIPFYTALYTLFSSIPMHSIFYSFLCFTTLPFIPYSILYSLLFCNFTMHPIFHFPQLYHVLLHCLYIAFEFFIIFHII